jgi:hypothetical protein
LEIASLDQSIDSDRRQDVAVGPKHGSDLVDMLRDIGIVFRAESGIACRATLHLTHAFCDTALRDAIHRSVTLLLQQVSKRACAASVALSIAAALDGSIVVRMDVLDPDGACVEQLPPAFLKRLARQRSRLLERGVRLETRDDSLSAVLVVPGALVSMS